MSRKNIKRQSRSGRKNESRTSDITSLRSTTSKDNQVLADSPINAKYG